MIGTFGMQSSHYPSMLQMVESRKLTPKAMVTSTIPLEKVSDTLTAMTNFENVGVTVINKY